MLNKILFFGNERLATGVTTAAPTLRALIGQGYEITGVIVAQSELGQSRNQRTLEIVQVAQEHNIPVHSPANLDDFQAEIKAMQAELGVLVAYGQIVPQAVIDLLPRGIVNIHPSLLPKYRGSTPIETTILNGDNQTGVSLMKLSSEMDAGPVYAQTKLDLSGQETKQELADQLHGLGKDSLIQHLSAILDGSLEAKPQTGEPSETRRIDKSNSDLDFTKPAIQLEREIRAFAGWPRSRTSIAGKDVIITKAHVGHPVGKLELDTAEGKLVIDELIPVGKKPMSAEAFLAGYQIK